MTQSPGSEGVYGVIPARYASSRFPGKPLAPIDGKPMILWVVERASQASSLKQVIVATDHDEIKAVVERAGHTAVMTSPDHPSGSDRVWEVVQALPDAQIIVNIQGDEPMVDPVHLDDLVAALQDDNRDDDMVTLATPITDPRELDDPNVVKVVVSQNGLALYFSRAPIPYCRNQEASKSTPYYRHIGLYGYKKSALQAFVNALPSPLEQTESLEQLRALELGLKIRVIEADTVGVGIDTPADLARLKTALKQ
ncbi:MAG: 3-deoxy-manno-octulosonate cytidylyltransferase [Cyanobacteria bacterium HKST-UBA06]|nr:3-deoxy-manno-octulosonate cytidylyltransferase [Cyanobacteria bacterium HKST-UBA06]